MQEYLQKTHTLIEALPYIRKFASKIVLIKYDGSAMENEELKHCAMQDIALLKLVSLKPVIVHDGGKDTSRLCKNLGVKGEFKNGLRISNQEATKVVEMTLLQINRSLVQSLECLGVKAIGICGKDAGLLHCVKKDGDLGFVGEISKVKMGILNELLEKDFLPVIAPVGIDENLNIYNINADGAAYKLARTLEAEKPVFLSDMAGLYRNYEDKNSLISKISLSEAKEPLSSLQGGMLVKLRFCIDACGSGVKKVHILNGCVKHNLLLEIFTDEGIGTLVV